MTQPPSAPQPPTSPRQPIGPTGQPDGAGHAPIGTSAGPPPYPLAPEQQVTPPSGFRAVSPTPPWPGPPSHPAPATTSQAPVRTSRRWLRGGRLVALAIGAAVVVAGASVGLTLAIDHPGSASPAPAPAAAAGGGAHAAGAGAVGEPSAAALVQHYTSAINQARGDDLAHLLCGGTGAVADTAPKWSWAFLALHEQIQPSQITTTSSGATSMLTISYQGQKSGMYGLIMQQDHGSWCVQAINDGSLGMTGLSAGGGR